MYLRILGDSASPTMPEIPHPSSRTVEFEWRMEVLKRKLLSEATQFANRGAIFQTTTRSHQDSCRRNSIAGIRNSWNQPAPVVPSSRSDENMLGDCWITRSRPATSNSKDLAFGSMNPRFWEGTLCENRRNDSNLSEIGSGNQVLIIYLPQDLGSPHLTQGAVLTTSPWECVWCVCFREFLCQWMLKRVRVYLQSRVDYRSISLIT